MTEPSTTPLPPTKRPPEARLRLRIGKLELICGRELPLVRFGRTSENDIVVDDEFASRRHGEIAYRLGKFQLMDHSSNGTLLVRSGGRGLHIQGETVLLEGQGALRCGNLHGSEIAFSVEIVSGDGRVWSKEEVALDPPPAAPNLVRCEGEYWTLAYEGSVLRLKDSKGLRYLARLLRYPGQEFHALDLASADSADATVNSKSPHPVDDKGHVDDGSGAGPTLDAHARTAYKQRITELREEAEEAAGLNDIGRADAARAELEFLSHELASAIGLGGRDRESSSNAERARVAVTLRIKSTLQKILNCHPSLGAYLAATVKTGRFCSYSPDPAHMTVWAFE